MNVGLALFDHAGVHSALRHDTIMEADRQERRIVDDEGGQHAASPVLLTAFWGPPMEARVGTTASCAAVLTRAPLTEVVVCVWGGGGEETSRARGSGGGCGATNVARGPAGAPAAVPTHVDRRRRGRRGSAVGRHRRTRITAPAAGSSAAGGGPGRGRHARSTAVGSCWSASRRIRVHENASGRRPAPRPAGSPRRIFAPSRPPDVRRGALIGSGGGGETHASGRGSLWRQRRAVYEVAGVTSGQVVAVFRRDVHGELVPVFREMLRAVATLTRSGDASVWQLKPEFR